MSKKTSELAAQVAAINRANAVAAELFPVLTEIFRPLVGEAVVTKPGPLTARVTKLLPVFPNTTELSVYRHSSDYSLAWTVSARESYPTGEGYSSSVRHECTFYIGDLDHQVLTKLCESYQNPPTWRTDYTVEEVLANREAARVAKKLYDEARSACYPFNET